jgi:heme-degrading monooxygenase HmoA
VDSVFIIDSWTVAPERRDEIIDALSRLFRDVLVHQPGFVSARLLESTDGDSVLAQVRMSTVEDRQRVEQIPEIRETLRDLRRIATAHAQRYRLVESFGEAAE